MPSAQGVARRGLPSPVRSSKRRKSSHGATVTCAVGLEGGEAGKITEVRRARKGAAKSGKAGKRGCSRRVERLCVPARQAEAGRFQDRPPPRVGRTVGVEGMRVPVSVLEKARSRGDRGRRFQGMGRDGFLGEVPARVRAQGTPKGGGRVRFCEIFGVEGRGEGGARSPEEARGGSGEAMERRSLLGWTRKEACGGDRREAEGEEGDGRVWGHKKVDKGMCESGKSRGCEVEDIGQVLCFAVERGHEEGKGAEGTVGARCEHGGRRCCPLGLCRVEGRDGGQEGDSAEGGEEMPEARVATLFGLGGGVRVVEPGEAAGGGDCLLARV